MATDLDRVYRGKKKCVGSRFGIMAQYDELNSGHQAASEAEPHEEDDLGAVVIEEYAGHIKPSSPCTRVSSRTGRIFNNKKGTDLHN